MILETNEFFTASVAAPERLEPLMNAVTDFIITFTEIQLEVLGPTIIWPGHQMVCHPSWKGISVSDDNMSFLSPKAYEAISLPYNSRLSQYFGGIALHSCGRLRHNIASQLRTPGLQQMECSACITVRDSDPNPNDPEHLRDGYRGTGVLVKVRINKAEVDLLDRLLAPDFKVAVAVTGVETREESEQVYQRFKDRIARITARWPD